MEAFYRLLAAHNPDAPLDPVLAAELEVEWWRVHRAHQGGEEGFEALATAIARLYAHTYAVEPDLVREPATLRAAAMDVSDAWVSRGCSPTDPELARERALLVRSYAALLAAVHR